jgi:hypothetical protein
VIPVVGTILGAVAGGWLGSELGGDEDPPEPHSNYTARIGFEDGQFTPMSTAHTYVRGLNQGNPYMIENPEYNPKIPEQIRNPEYQEDPRTGIVSGGPEFIPNPNYEPQYIKNPDYIDPHEYIDPNEQRIIDYIEGNIDNMLADYTNKFNQFLNVPSVNMDQFNAPTFQHFGSYHGDRLQAWMESAQSDLAGEPLQNYKQDVQQALEHAGLYTNLAPLATGMQAGPGGYFQEFRTSRNPQQDTLQQVLSTLM